MNITSIMSSKLKELMKMDLHEISTNVAVAIPYRNFNEKINIVSQELRKNRHVEVMDKYIYSAEKWRDEDGDTGEIFN